MMRATLAALFVAGLAAAPAAAQTAYVVHGIPGPGGFPVDIAVNDTCAVQGVTFGQILGPVSLPSPVNVKIYADTGECAGTPALVADLELEAGRNYSIVAHLDAYGAPKASLFTNDLGALPAGSARVIAHHTAEAPAVDITVARAFYSSGRSPRLAVKNVENGSQTQSIVVRPGDWQVAIAPAGNPQPVFGPATLTLEPYRTYLVYAVGSLADGSFTPLIKAVPVSKAAR